ncbi:MAG: zinc ribbon domain-containing protein [Chloroflexota bacterium]|nr:zinc ribbon domain-containing protein [Chloroflexota bacterium]
MPFCRYCAHQVPERATFCGWCGQSLPGAPASSNVSMTQASADFTPTAQTPERVDQREAASRQEQRYRELFVPPIMPPPAIRAMPTVPGTPQIGHVPMVHGAPPVGHVPIVQGMPQPAGLPPTPAASPTGGPPIASHMAGAHGVSATGTTAGGATGATVGGATGATATGTTAGGVLGATAVLKVIVIIAIIASATTGTTLAALRLFHPGSASTHGQTGVITQRMPATLTSCPAPGTARALVSRPLATGKDDTLVYAQNGPAATALKRYDAKTGRTVTFYNAAHSTIAHAQISADGQWVLFDTAVTTVIAGAGKYAILGKMQMIRLDGQGLQTLYCFSNQYSGNNFPNQYSSGNVTLSPDRHYVAFGENNYVYLLNLQTGQLQKEVSPLRQDQYNYTYFFPRGWMDKTHLYLTSIPMTIADGGNPSGLYLLNISQGPLASAQNLPQVRKTLALFCWDFDENPARTSLYYSQCPDSQGGYTPGTSFIARQPAMGGPESTIYSTTTNMILNVRAMNDKTVFFYMGKGMSPNSSGGPPTAGAANVGWWKINDDGSGLTRLTTDTSQTANDSTHSPWASVSRDGHFYLLYNYGNPGAPTAVRMAPAAGGAPVTIASGASPSLSAPQGWPATVVPAGWTLG